MKANQTETKYIKQGGTWFNQECWNDEYKIDSNPKTNYSNYQPKLKAMLSHCRIGYLDNRMKRESAKGVN